MKSVLELYRDIIKQYDDLEKFIIELDVNREYYSKNREILYTGIINRGYSLWETFNKNIVFIYYEKIREELIKNGNLVSKLRLHELPAYIVEKGCYNSENDYVYYDLKEEFITHTAKNMDTSQMTALYDRVGLSIVRELEGKPEIKAFFASESNTFNISENDPNKLNGALKIIINERNSTAHYARIENYMDLSYIKDWIKFYVILLQEISKIVCHELSKKNKIIDKNVGIFQSFLTVKKVLCIDLSDGICVTKESLIGIIKNNKLVDIVKPISFNVDGVDKDSISENEKVGISLSSLFGEVTTINKSSKIYILNE